MVEDRRQTLSTRMLMRKQGKLNESLSFAFDIYVGQTSVLLAV